ncbi:uncharacterized protein LOC144695514 [Cetorhinus maximus]
MTSCQMWACQFSNKLRAHVARQSVTMATEQCATTALFLLISICTTGTEAATSPIVQSPASVHIFEGGSVTLNCTFHLKGLGTYSWRRDDSPIDFQSPRYKKRIMKADHNAFSSRNDASIQIKNMTQCESGTYYCEIEIMGNQKLAGNGTLVTVQHTCDKLGSLKKHPFDWMWAAVAGGVTLLITLALLVVIIVLARRNKAYALLVRECSSFDSAKEPEMPQRNKVRNHAQHQVNACPSIWLHALSHPIILSTQFKEIVRGSVKLRTRDNRKSFEMDKPDIIMLSMRYVPLQFHKQSLGGSTILGMVTEIRLQYYSEQTIFFSSEDALKHPRGRLQRLGFPLDNLGLNGRVLVCAP